MKGDFTRNTFNPKKHYRDVLLQQGRVQVDADFNEQAALTARRDETTTADIIGDCGGPADNAAFGIIRETTIPLVANPAGQESIDTAKAALPPDGTIILPTRPGNFLLSAGRYYVDGIQCENEEEVLYTAQPDRFDVPGLRGHTSYLVYLDVWQRHIMALEDGLIREPALGGPDHGTRAKTIWQVRALPLAQGIDSGNPCGSGADKFNQLFDPGTAQLTAGTAAQPAPKDPCLIPASAGYTGLENQLYRVEIHDPATWKWSRENGSVVTRIERINGDEITVSSLGPDKNLGFVKDAWVEILDDALELESRPGQLAQIDDVDEATRIIKLKSVASSLLPAGFSATTYPNAIVPERHPKLRRWEGIVTPIKVGTWLPLESGVQVNFAPNGDYRTGHFWQIPARTATAQSPTGDIEWPVDNAGNRAALAAFGIKHHLCRLGIVTVFSTGSIEATDCRCLWPALTQLPRLFYVSGDGQEVMPDLTDTTGKRYKLPQPLIVGLGNGQCAPQGMKVRFSVIAPPSTGRVAVVGTSTPTGQIVDVPLGADGMASCDFHLDGTNNSQQVRAQLLDAAGVPCSLPIIFNANLSKASEVAYDPGKCVALQGKKTVQDAMAHLASLTRLEALGGDGQDAEPGKTLANPIRVLVTSSCGPVVNAKVQFTVADNNKGTVTPIEVTTLADGVATCLWTPDPNPALPTQELTATLVLPDKTVLGQPAILRFTANLRAGKDCCVTVGAGGDFADLNGAISELKAKRPEICICLLPGDHIVSALEIVGATASALPIIAGTTADALPANVATTAKAVGTNGGTPSSIVLRHLHIHGCGRGSRILLGTALTVQSLDSIRLHDLCIYADVLAPPPPAPASNNHSLLIANCGDVTITGCHLRQKGSENAWVTISGAGRIHIADNVILSTREVSSVVLLAGSANSIPGATQAASPNVQVLAQTAAANLAGKSKSERAAFVKEFRKIVNNVPPSEPHKKPLTAALKHLSAISRRKQKPAAPPLAAPISASINTPQGLAESVKGITQSIGVAPQLTPVPVPALVIADAQADTAIVNNNISGEVRIYGGLGSAPPAKFEALARRLRNPSGSASPSPQPSPQASPPKDVLLVDTPRRSLRIEGNMLTKVVVADTKVPDQPVAGKTFSIENLFMRMSLLDNTFDAMDNQWLALHVISNGNHFVVTANGQTIGTAIGVTFICSGTSANRIEISTNQLQAKLQYGVPPVGTGQPPRFIQSANLITLTQL